MSTSPSQDHKDPDPIVTRLDRIYAHVWLWLDWVCFVFGMALLLMIAYSIWFAPEPQTPVPYTKAVEQLASSSMNVRIDAIYALQRIANESPLDSLAIRNILTTFIRNRDFCSAKQQPKECNNKPVKPSTAPHTPLAADIHTALTVASTLKPLGDTTRADLSRVRFPTAILTAIDLTGANLTGANLNGTDLNGANLSQSRMEGARLTGASMLGVNLADAKLIGATLTQTDLNHADLTNANLTGANLSGANLTDADLSGANLTGTDLTGANLTGVKGITADEIRDQAITDDDTAF